MTVDRALVIHSVGDAGPAVEADSLLHFPAGARFWHRFRKATVTFPGGCEIGLRPIDLHLSGSCGCLGVEDLRRRAGSSIAKWKRACTPGEVHFDYPSVGATENVMMAAVPVPGATADPSRRTGNRRSRTCRRLINAMGGRVRGAGGHCDRRWRAWNGLHGTAWTPMADRIVAGTLLAAAAVTGGEVTLTNAPESDMVAVTAKLREMGCRLAEAPGTDSR